VLAEFFQAKMGMHRSRIAHHVQVGRTEINNALAAAILDVCLANVPFLRDDPVEHLLAGWNFSNGEGNFLPQNLKRSADAVAGNAAADRVNFGG